MSGTGAIQVLYNEPSINPDGLWVPDGMIKAYDDALAQVLGETALTLGINQQLSNYTLVASDAAKMVQISNALGRTLTVPAHSSVAFPVGQVIYVEQGGIGTVTIAGDVGVTINSLNGSLTLAGAGAVAMLVQITQDNWVATGDLTQSSSAITQTHPTIGALSINTGTSVTPAANHGYGFPFNIPQRATVSKVRLWPTTSAGNIDFGIYSGDGQTKYGSTGTVACPAAGQRDDINLTQAITLPAGEVFIMIAVTDNTCAFAANSTNWMPGVINPAATPPPLPATINTSIAAPASTPPSFAFGLF